jgi:hypothetical protein
VVGPGSVVGLVVPPGVADGVEVGSVAGWDGLTATRDGEEAVALGRAAIGPEDGAMTTPAVSAIVARTRFRTPMATTRRARCADVMTIRLAPTVAVPTRSGSLEVRW